MENETKYLKIKIYRTIILPVVLYGCEAWSLTLREERNLRVFENMALRRIFRPRMEEITEEWRRLHNDELNDVYPLLNIVRVIKSRRMRWAGLVACMVEERGVYRVLVGKMEGKRPLGRTRRRWVDNIRMDFQEVGCGYMDWIGLAQDRDRWRKLVSAVMNLTYSQPGSNTIDSIHFNSFQFNGHSITFRLNSTSAYYKASTKTQIKHNNVANIQKRNTQNKNKMVGKYNTKSTGEKSLNP